VTDALSATSSQGVTALAVAPSGRDRPKMPAWKRREQAIGFLGILPALVMVLAVILYPAGYALWISFHKSDGIDFEWIGLKNYGELLTDPVVHQVFLNNIKFLISVPLIIFTALIVAVLLFERIRGWKYFRVIFFLPSVLSVAVIGLMFRTAFGYEGPVNAIVTKLGYEPIQFFIDENLAMGVIVLALIWSGFGYQSLLLLTGLTSIDPAIFEAAMIDGAGWWKRLWFITIPNIRRTLGFVFIINVLYTFTALFGFVFVMTAGGPGYATTTIDYLIYLKAFSGSNLGPGAALAVMLFLVVGLLTIVQARFFRLGEED